MTTTQTPHLQLRSTVLAAQAAYLNAPKYNQQLHNEWLAAVAALKAANCADGAHGALTITDHFDRHECLDCGVIVAR